MIKKIEGKLRRPPAYPPIRALKGTYFESAEAVKTKSTVVLKAYGWSDVLNAKRSRKSCYLIATARIYTRRAFRS